MTEKCIKCGGPLNRSPEGLIECTICNKRWNQDQHIDYDEWLSARIESLEKNGLPKSFNDELKEIKTYLESIEKMYEATMEIFVLKDNQSTTFFNQLKGEINQLNAVIMVMWNKLMVDYPEYSPVKIPIKYQKYKPPKTTNKLLRKYFRKNIKKLTKWMQEKNKHGSNHKSSRQRF